MRFYSTQLWLLSLCLTAMRPVGAAPAAAGDTLPINLPYTMPPAEAAKAARMFRQRVLYPYHQGKSDPAELKRLLANLKGTEVRVRALP